MTIWGNGFISEQFLTSLYQRVDIEKVISQWGYKIIDKTHKQCITIR